MKERDTIKLLKSLRDLHGAPMTTQMYRDTVKLIKVMRDLNPSEGTPEATLLKTLELCTADYERAKAAKGIALREESDEETT